MQRVKNSLLPGLAAFAALAIVPATAATRISSFAGPANGGGYLDGSGTAVKFSAPRGVAVCPSGDIFVADTGNHVIRRTTPEGLTTTLAGKAGDPGSADGTAGARFNLPRGIAADSACNLYVTDSGSHLIRRISSGGAVTTIAGAAGQAGGADGRAEARFNRPGDLIIDSTGVLFVADTGNHTIRRIAADGEVTTFAGVRGVSGILNGTGTGASFNSPTSIAMDAAGIIYIGDSLNRRIRRITAGAVVDDLLPSGVQVGSVIDVAVGPDGRVYWTDGERGVVQRFNTAVETVAGTSFTRGHADGAGAAARFNEPASIAAAPDGSFVIAEAGNHVLRRMRADVVSTVVGSAPLPGTDDGIGAQARFVYPGGVAFDRAGNLYVGEQNRVRRIAPDGTTTTITGRSGESGVIDGPRESARLESTQYIAADDQGNIYTSEFWRHVVRKISPDGSVSTFVGRLDQPGTTDGDSSVARIKNPRGLAVDTAGNLYVGDAGNGAIRKVTPAGVVSTLASSAGAIMNLTIDDQGNLYYGDEPSRVRRVTPAGEVTTIFTLPQTVGEPRIARQSDGTVYVVDVNRHSIRRFTPAGQYDLYAGRDESPGNQDGSLEDGRFFLPRGMAVSPDGRLFVADTFNHAIRVLDEREPVTIDSFTATPRNIEQGGQSTLAWTSRNGTSADIQPGIGAVPLSGSIAVSPEFSTTYTLTVRGANGSVSARATVTLPGTRRRGVRR
jgi:sugar lactone lactonase YvrE